MSSDDTSLTIPESGNIVMVNPVPADYSFYGDGVMLLKFCSDGDIYIRGEKVDSNKEVYEALVDFLYSQKARIADHY